VSKAFLFVFSTILLMSLNSCDKSVNYDEPEPVEKLVIESYLVEGDSVVFVRVGKTISAYDNGNHASAADTNLAALGAEVRVSFDNETVTLQEAKPGNPYFFGGRPGFYPTYYNTVHIPAGKKCTLDVKYKNHHIVSEAGYPSRPTINSSTCGIELKDGYVFYNLVLNLDYDADGGKYYRISVTSENAASSIQRNSIMYQYLILEGSGKSQNYNLRIKGLKSNGDLSGLKKVLITLEHISKEYYDFMYAIPEFRRSILNDYNTEVVEIPTNITGGLGIFTISSKDTSWALIKN